MGLLKLYWEGFKKGEDFSKFSETQIPQVYLFNIIGVIFCSAMFILISNFLRWVFGLLSLFYIYRFLCFQRYIREHHITIHLNKKKDL